jgi:hypothetical protein
MVYVYKEFFFYLFQSYYSIGIESARMMVYRSAVMRDNGERNTWHASIAKGMYIRALLCFMLLRPILI